MVGAVSWRLRLATAEVVGLGVTLGAVASGATEAIALVPLMVGAGAWFGCAASGRGRRPVLVGLLVGCAVAVVVYVVLLALAVASIPRRVLRGRLHRRRYGLWMSITVPCRRCGLELSAETEDDLVEQVRAHIRDVHHSPHVPPRDHLLEHATRDDR